MWIKALRFRYSGVTLYGGPWTLPTPAQGQGLSADVVLGKYRRAAEYPPPEPSRNCRRFNDGLIAA
jgi:hypothetical protein